MKKFYSTETKKFYDTAEACDAAEAEIIRARKKAKEEKERREAERKIREEELDEALQKMEEAREEYEKLLAEYTKAYGTFKCSASDKQEFLKDLDWLFKRI